MDDTGIPKMQPPVREGAMEAFKKPSRVGNERRAHWATEGRGPVTLGGPTQALPFAVAADLEAQDLRRKF